METTNTFFSGATARARLWMLAGISAAALGASAPAAAQALTAQTITFGALANKVAGDADFSVSAAADSGLPVSFAAAGSCTVAGNVVHLLTVLRGTCAITASQAGDASYSPATDVVQSFTISAAVTALNSDLHAVAGATTLPGLASAVPVLGYSSTGAAVTQPGGPTLVFNQGDTVTITLHNSLSVPTGLLLQGQALPPDTTGVPAGGFKTYTFVAGQPGTYLYEAAPLAGTQNQVARGLYGALVVLPATSGQAYGDAATAYDAESVLVLSEIDPVLNSSANPALFDMRNFAPRYFLINGKVYPNTDPISAVAGKKLLLRYVNAGAKHHSMAALGLRQNFVAKDGSLLPTANHNVVAETLAPGQTGDAIATIPAAAVDGSRFALYEGGMLPLRNSNQAGFGGMMTFVTVAGTAATADTQGPVTSALSVSATGQINATVSDADTGNSAIAVAEYFLDAIGSAGGGTAMVVTPTTASTASVQAQLTLPLTSGNHTIYVHGQDSAGNWGAVLATPFNVDGTGPVTSALALSPNLTNGSVNVALTGTANDTATGGSNIGAAQYRIDTGPWVNMAISTAGVKVSGITASIPAATVNALAPGQHVISVHSQDTAAGLNWGAEATVALVVNKAGAATTAVSASPNPNNGTRALSASQPVVRVTALVTSDRVVAAEGFIDTVGAVGTGFPFTPTDGAFGGTTETVFGDIPLSTVKALTAGPHTIHVRGKDGGGSWGTTSSTTLLVDKLAPTLSVSLAPSTIAAGSATVVSVTASDTNGITARQYWVDGTATPPASPLSFTGNSINLTGLSGGTHTVYVRVQDTATNWSNVVSATVSVVQAVSDARPTITANNNAAQTADTNAASNLLVNDQPLGTAGRTVKLATAPVRASGTGTGTLTVSCPGALGTGATPAIGVNTICTNGAYRVNLTGNGANGAARQASKRGTFTFTYTETLNGVTSTPAAVTITVN